MHLINVYVFKYCGVASLQSSVEHAISYKATAVPSG